MNEQVRTYLILMVALSGLGVTFVAWGHQLRDKPFAVARMQASAFAK